MLSAMLFSIDSLAYQNNGPCWEEHIKDEMARSEQLSRKQVAVKLADIIFIGTVLENTVREVDTDMQVERISTSFEVREFFKGEATSKINISGRKTKKGTLRESDCACTYDFLENHTYIVYADEDRGSWVTYECRHIGPATPDILEELQRDLSLTSQSISQPPAAGTTQIVAPN